MQMQPRAVSVYVGTYTGKGSEGIYVFPFDPTTGQMGRLTLAAQATRPSFLALHPNGRTLYAVDECNQAGAVAAFARDQASGTLTPLNHVSSQGRGACHVTIDASGRTVLVANYGSGSVAACAVQKDGHLLESASWIQHRGSSVNPRRQEGPHAHALHVAPDNRFALAVDLGLDQILVYRLDAAAATLTPHAPPFASVAAGAGPRHAAFHPQLPVVYVINELASTVTALGYDAAAGTLAEQRTVSILPPGFTGQNDAAEVVVHPSGRFLYASNRGHDSLAVFAIDRTTGALTARGHVPVQGRWPRHFALDPSGTWVLVANQHTDNIAAFRIDPGTGIPTPTGQSVTVSQPTCVLFAAVPE